MIFKIINPQLRLCNSFMQEMNQFCSKANIIVCIYIVLSVQRVKTTTHHLTLSYVPHFVFVCGWNQ